MTLTIVRWLPVPTSPMVNERTRLTLNHHDENLGRHRLSYSICKLPDLQHGGLSTIAWFGRYEQLYELSIIEHFHHSANKNQADHCVDRLRVRLPAAEPPQASSSCLCLAVTTVLSLSIALLVLMSCRAHVYADRNEDATAVVATAVRCLPSRLRKPSILY